MISTGNSVRNNKKILNIMTTVLKRSKTHRRKLGHFKKHVAVPAGVSFEFTGEDAGGEKVELGVCWSSKFSSLFACLGTFYLTKPAWARRSRAPWRINERVHWKIQEGGFSKRRSFEVSTQLYFSGLSYCLRIHKPPGKVGGPHPDRWGEKGPPSYPRSQRENRDVGGRGFAVKEGKIIRRWTCSSERVG